MTREEILALPSIYDLLRHEDRRVSEAIEAGTYSQEILCERETLVAREKVSYIGRDGIEVFEFIYGNAAEREIQRVGFLAEHKNMDTLAAHTPACPALNHI